MKVWGFLISLIFISNIALATTFTCGKVQETSPSKFGSDNLFHVSLYRDCQGTSNSPFDISKIKLRFMEMAVQNVQLKNTTANEVYQGLPSTRYDVVESVNDHGQGSIYRQTHVASSSNEVLIDSRSQRIEVNGDAALTKKRDWSIRAQIQGQQMIIRFTETTYLQKKGPAPIFKRMALSTLKSDFNDESSSHLETLSKL